MQSVDCFDSIPTEIFQNILLLSPHEYYTYTLNNVSKSWHETITLLLTKEDPLNSSQSPIYQYFYPPSLNQNQVYLLQKKYPNQIKLVNRLFQDYYQKTNPSLDRIPLWEGLSNFERNTILTIFLIKYNRNNELEKLPDNFFISSDDYFYLACYYGSLECLDFLVRNMDYISNFLSEFACINASSNGHVKCLKYLDDSKLSNWNKECCKEAAMNGHLECLMYLRENGCTWDSKFLLHNVQNQEILNYIKEMVKKNKKKKKVLVRTVSNPSMNRFF